MTDVAARIDELRLAVGEADTLAAVTLKWFDAEGWSSADPVLVEHAGFMLGVIAKSAAFAASKIDGFLGAAFTLGAVAQRCDHGSGHRTRQCRRRYADKKQFPRAHRMIRIL